MFTLFHILTGDSKMKAHEYLVIAGISVLSVYIVNHYLISNFTVNTVGAAGARTLNPA
jgi:hypothetical protein